jgi:Family of unknown function (DUF5677)
MTTIPDHDRQLVADLATGLRRATEILGAARPKDGYGETLPLVVLMKGLRIALSTVVLIERGYADEAGPLLRALAAGTITFAALTQQDSEDRGYLFARHGRDRHLKWVDSSLMRSSVIEAREHLQDSQAVQTCGMRKLLQQSNCTATSIQANFRRFTASTSQTDATGATFARLQPT